MLLLSPEAREVRAREYPGTGARNALAEAERATTETNAVRTIVVLRESERERVKAEKNAATTSANNIGEGRRGSGRQEHKNVTSYMV